jgi:hypothetical protein
MLTAVRIGVIYGFLVSEHEDGKSRLEAAVKTFLNNVGAEESLLWSMSYRVIPGIEAGHRQTMSSQISRFAARAFDVALDDAILSDVKQAWEKVLGPGVAAESTFLRFEERENESED